MFTGTQWIRLASASVVLLFCVTGCFQRAPDLAPVTGIVTLDDEPLVGAQVEFNPMQGNPSYGTTYQRGRYELWYTKDKKGAVVGSHVVRITTQTTVVDPETGAESQVAQRVPERYNERSELIRDVRPVEAGNENVIVFVLNTEPEDEEAGPETERAPEEKAPEKKAPEEKTPEAGAEGPKTEAREPKGAEAKSARAEKES